VAVLVVVQVLVQEEDLEQVEVLVVDLVLVEVEAVDLVEVVALVLAVELDLVVGTRVVGRASAETTDIQDIYIYVVLCLCATANSLQAYN
jgi:hypothetical protein